MVSVKLFIAAAAAVIVSTTAHAADMPLPAPQIVYQQPPCCETGRWYLRGDVGVGVQTFSSFDHGQTNSVFVWPASWTIVQKDIQDTAIFGAGIGYAWNSWLRFDVTGEYRTKAGFKATGRYTEFCGGANCFDINTGNLSSAVFLANAYVDLGTWWCLTPFIGAGVGGARNMITSVQDQGIESAGTLGFGFERQRPVESRLGCHSRPDLQRQRQSQDRPELALSQSRLAADRGGSVSEHGVLPGRLLHAARRDLAGFPGWPPLAAPGGRLRLWRFRAAGIRSGGSICAGSGPAICACAAPAIHAGSGAAIHATAAAEPRLIRVRPYPAAPTA